MKIKQALIKAQKQFKKNKISSAGLDAEVLLLETIRQAKCSDTGRQKIEIDKNWLCARPEYELNKDQKKKFESFIKRRLKDEPIAYIISRKEFFGLDFYVDKRVMIPRPETEIIVENIINELNFCKFFKDAKQHKHFSNILDVGTGSGCISIALAKNIFQRRQRYGSSLSCVKFYAIDISKEAIEVAKINAKKNKIFSRIKFLKGNLLEPIQKLKIKNQPTIIIANLPYLKMKDIKKNISLTYEPISALDGGKGGLEKIKELVLQIKKINFNIFECWLEINSEQTKDLIYFVKKKLSGVKIKIIKDLSGQNRFLRISKNLI